MPIANPHIPENTSAIFSAWDISAPLDETIRQIVEARRARL